MALGGLGFRIHLGIEKRSKKGYFFLRTSGFEDGFSVVVFCCVFLMIELVLRLLLKRLVIGW